MRHFSFLLIFNFITILGFSLTWPITSMKVVAGYGSYEGHLNTAPNYHQHTGIDINAPAGTAIKAIGNGTIINVVQDGNSFIIFLELDDGDRIQYGHVEQGDITRGALYLYDLFPFGFLGPKRVAEGDNIGVVSIASQAHANVSHSHLHLNYLKNWNSGLSWTAVNPIDYLNPNDPFPGNSPQFGPLYFKTLISHAYENIPCVFKKVEIINEMTDNQGDIVYSTIGPNTILDEDAYGLPELRLNAKIADPLSIEFNILDVSGSEVYPNVPNKKCKFIFSNPDPIAHNRWPITNFDNLFDLDNNVYTETDAIHCFRLTNILPTTIDADNPIGEIYTSTVTEPTRYWNTNLNQSALSWNGLSATSPLDAKYPDGNYKIKIIASDKSHTSVPNERSIIIDNWKPFVSKLTVKAGDLQRLIYSAEWVLNSSEIKLHPSERISSSTESRIIGNFIPILDGYITIEVTFSEEMNQTTTFLSIRSDDAPNFTSTIANVKLNVVPNTNNKVFTCQIDDGPFQAGITYLQDILIVGTDLMANDLLGYSEMTPTVPLSKITHRDTNGSWYSLNTCIGINNNIDDTHHFTVVGCNEGFQQFNRLTSSNCIVPDFSVNENYITAGTEVRFTDLTSGNPDSRLWEFGDGSISREQSPTHTYNSGGVFDVTLTVTYANGNSESETKYSYIYVSTGGNLTANFDLPGSINEGSSALFANTSTGGEGNITYSWSITPTSGVFPNTSTTFSPTIFFSNGGDYSITLTAKDEGIPQHISNKNLTFHVGAIATIPLFHFSPNANPSGNTYEYNLSITGEADGEPPYIFERWDFGDGQSSTIKETSHIFAPGLYTLKAYMHDGSGISNYNTVQIQVLPNPDLIAQIGFDLTPTNLYGCGGSGLRASAKIQPSYLANNIMCLWKVEKSGCTNHSFSSLCYYSELANIPILGNSVTEFDYRYFEPGEYTITLVVTLNGITYNPVYKNITLCPIVNPLPVTIEYFRLKNQCYGSNMEVKISGSENFFSFDELPNTYNSGLFGLDHPLHGVIINHSKLDFPGSDYYYPYTITYTQPNVFPVQVTYTLIVYLHKDDNHDGKWDELPPQTITATLYDCMNADDIIVGANEELNVCPGKSIVLGGDHQIESGVPPYTFSWEPCIHNVDHPNPIGYITNPNSYNAIFSTINPGTYYYDLHVTDATNYSLYKEIKINVADLIVQVTPPSLSICIHSSQQINTTTSNGNGQYTYLWSPNINLNSNTQQNPTLTSNTLGDFIYNLTVTDNATNCQVTKQIQAKFSNSFPTVSLGNDQVGCSGKEYILSGNISSFLQNYKYKWSGGDQFLFDEDASNVGIITTSVNPYTTTTYKLEVTDIVSNCTSQDQTTVFIDQSISPTVELTSTSPLNDKNEIYLCDPWNIDLGVISSNTNPDYQPSSIHYYWGYSYNLNNHGYNFQERYPAYRNQTNVLINDYHEINNIDHNIVMMTEDNNGCKSLSNQINIFRDEITYTPSAPIYGPDCLPGLFPIYFSITCNAQSNHGVIDTYAWNQLSLIANGNSEFEHPITHSNTVTMASYNSESKYIICDITNSHGCHLSEAPLSVLNMYSPESYYLYDNEYHPENLINIENENHVACGGLDPVETCFSLKDPYKYNPNSWFPSTQDAINAGFNVGNPLNHFHKSIPHINNGNYYWNSYTRDCIKISSAADITIPALYDIWCYMGDIINIPIHVTPYQNAYPNNIVCGDGHGYFGNINSWANQSAVCIDNSIKGISISTGYTDPFTFCGTPSDRCPHTEVPDGMSLTLEARDEIIFKAGPDISNYFSCDYGGELLAFINPCLKPSNYARYSNQTPNLIVPPKTNNNSTKNLSIFPNPSPGIVKIILNNPRLSQTEIELKDATGRLLKNLISGEIEHFDRSYDFSNLGNGIYYIYCKTQDEVVTEKLIIQN